MPSEQQQCSGWNKWIWDTEITKICTSKVLLKALLLPKPLVAAVTLLETNLSYNTNHVQVLLLFFIAALAALSARAGSVVAQHLVQSHT